MHDRRLCLIESRQREEKTVTWEDILASVPQMNDNIDDKITFQNVK